MERTLTSHGRRRENQCFGEAAYLETFRTVGGLQNFPDVRNERRSEHTTTNLSSQRAVTCTLHEKEQQQ